MKGLINIEFKKIEEGLIPIYENESKERLINARELHRALKCNTKFADWIKRKIKHYEFIENREYICFLKFEKAEKYGNRTTREYYLTIDIKIQNNYCLASDIAEQLNLYSENKIPHSNLIGAIARQLGYKVSYKHYYEDNHIAIIKDISKNEYWQVYFKPLAVQEIIEWFNKNKEELYYEIQYVKNTKNGKKGEVKEKGYKIENISYKII